MCYAIVLCNDYSCLRKNTPNSCKHWRLYGLAEGVGFEPTVRLPARLISSQVPSTTQPPFHRLLKGTYLKVEARERCLCPRWCCCCGVPATISACWSANGTAGSPTAENGNSTERQSHAPTFTKVVDGRKQPIRGLWVRNGRFHAQLWCRSEERRVGKECRS